jgi:glycine/D-amino acid oxidase-like deaminating enzyme
MLHPHYDALVIGGGFYGCCLAERLRLYVQRVVVLEAQGDLLQRASFVNQARVHNGYHYPRSILTSLRSRVNFPRFVADFPAAIDADFSKYYAIARRGSKVTARQFRQFCERVGAPLGPAPKDVQQLFDDALIEEVFEVTEYAFDASLLKQTLAERLAAAGVEVVTRARALRVSGAPDGAIDVIYRTPEGESSVRAGRVFNCTYSQVNALAEISGLPILPLKHELTEVILVDLPEVLRGLGITVMDGPFFSVMPFPARQAYSFTHVRYTPLTHWYDRPAQPYANPDRQLHQDALPSRFIHMRNDARRYLPPLGDCRYRESLWEVKTVLPQSETDDSRPILFARVPDLPNLFHIMGGKIDNIYDILDKLDGLMTERGVST